MADRYWVGGTANWDGTAGSKWATTSGGAGGASVPTTADDVFFDAASGVVTCTIATGNTGAKSINCTGFTGTIAGTAPITVSGNLTFPSVGNVFYTGTITFNANATIVSNGKGSDCNFEVNGTGITVQLGDDIFPNRLIVTKGTLTTNNLGITTNRFTCNGTDACTINLGSSTVTLINLITGNGGYQLDFSNSNLTLNAGTSLISGTNLTTSSTLGSTLFNGGGKTFYDVSVAMTTTIPNETISEPSPTFLGNNTFRNLTLNNPYTPSSRGFALGGNQTVTGTLTCSGGSTISRYFLYSTPVQTVRTITANAIVADDCDFRDITLAGAAAGSSPARAGNCGGNTGITFPAAKTVYRVGTSTIWYSTTSWATSSGGTAASTNIPLAQDTAVFDFNSTFTGTVTAGASNIGNIDLSAKGTQGTVSLSSSFVYGNLICKSNVGIGGSAFLYGRGTQGLTSAGRTLSLGIRKKTTVGTFQLNDAFTRLDTGSNFYIIGGTFTTNGYTVLADIYYPATSTSATFNFGASSITSTTMELLGSSLTLNASSASLTVSSLNVGSTSATFANITTSGATAGTSTFARTTGSLACTNFTVNPPTSGNGLRAVSLGLNINITGTLTLTAGTTSLRRSFLLSDTIGTARTLTCAAVSGSLADVDFRNITIAGAAAPISGTRFGNCGGNSGITFSAPKNVYWVAAAGTSWLSDSWSTTAGGIADLSNFPLAQDTVIFEDAYPTSGTVTLNGCNIGTFDTSTRTTALTLSAGTTGSIVPMVYGDWKFGALVSISGGFIHFMGNTAQTIFSNGRTFNLPLTLFNLAGVSLNDDLNIGTSSLYLQAGTFSAGANNVTAGNFYIESDIAKTLNMGSGVWYLSNAWSIDAISLPNFTFNKGTANIQTVSDSASIFVFVGGGLAYNKLTMTGTGTAQFRFFDGGNSFTEVASTRTNAHTITLYANQGLIDVWSISGSPSNQVTLNSSTVGTQRTFNLTNVSENINYLTVQDIGVVNANRFYVGFSSIDGGNNTNVYFESLSNSFLLLF